MKESVLYRSNQLVDANVKLSVGELVDVVVL